MARSKHDATIIAIVAGIIAATRDWGEKGDAFVHAVMDPEVLSAITWTEKDVQKLCVELRQRRFTSSPDFILAMHQYHVDGHDQGDPEEAKTMLSRCWNSAFHMLEHEGQADLFSQFEAGCYVWMHIGKDHKGKVMSSIRRTIPALRVVEVSDFVKQLDRRWQGDKLASQLCAALFEFRTGDPVDLWNKISDAFTGKFNGFDAWKRAQEIVGAYKAFDALPYSQGERHRVALVEELSKLMGNCSYDEARIWLLQQLHKAA